MATGTFCGTGLGGNAPLPGDPDNNSILSAVPAFGGIDVSWTYPTTNPQGVAYTNLYRATSGTEAPTTVHAVVSGNFFYDKTDTVTLTTYFYWIEIVSINGTVGELIGPASSTAEPPIEQVLQGLTGKIDNGKLATSLKGELDRIPQLETSINDETNARLADMDALGTAFNQVQGVSDETRALLDQETLDRQNADSAFVTQVNQVYTDMDESLAQQKTTLTTEYELAISQAVTDLVSQTDMDGALASLSTTLQAEYEDHVAQQLTSYETAATAQAARASLTSALQAQVDDNNALVLNEQQARADGDSALASQVDALSVKIDSLPVFSSGFEDGSDFTQWTASTGHTLAQDSDAFIGTQAGLITSTATAPLSSGIPEGVVATIPEGTAAAFSGKRIRLRLSAKQPASSASAEFAITYSTNDGADSGWQTFVPTASWTTFEFTYDVPANGTATDYLALWGDTSGSGLGVLVDALSVEATASEIPEFTAAIQTEQQARIDGDEALSGRIDALTASVDADIEAAIVSEQTARVSADEALAEDVSLLSGRVGTNESQIFSLEEAFADDQVATALRDSLLSVQSAAASAMVRTEETARVEEDTALATRITTVEADVAGNSAAIQTEETARVDGDSALGTQITTVQTDLEGTISTVQQDLTSETTRLDGRIDTNASAITTVQSNLDSGLATAQTNLDTEVTELRGDIDSNSTALTTAQTSLGDEIATVETKLDASVSGEILLRNGTFASGTLTGWTATDAAVVAMDGTSAEPAVATLPTGYGVHLTPTSEDPQQLFLEGEQLFVSRDESYVFRLDYAAGSTATAPQLIMRIQWQDVNGVDLSVTDKAVSVGSTAWTRMAPQTVKAPEAARYARVRVLGDTGAGDMYVANLIAQRSDATLGALYTAKVEASGLVGGFSIFNDGEEVEAGFDVDRFWIGRTNLDKIKPFIVDTDGTTYINEAVIKSLTFNKLRADDGSFIVENGKVKGDYIDADTLHVAEAATFTGVAQSTNFVSGSQGWKLDPAGSGEINFPIDFGNITNTGSLLTADKFGRNNLLQTESVTITSSDVLSDASYLTDGIRAISTDYWSLPSGPQYIEADLGRVVFIGESRVYFYNRDGRYYQYALAVSETGEDGDWVWLAGDGSNGAVTSYAASRNDGGGSHADGLVFPTIDGASRFGRYVRLFMNGSTANTGNHGYEWELWASASGIDPYTSQLNQTSSSWVRPNTTKIDGNKIYTGDAYVDTLQIKGNAVTIPASAWTSGSTNVSDGSWSNAQTVWYNPQGGSTSSTFGFSYHASVDVSGGGTSTTTKYIAVEARFAINGWVVGNFGYIDYGELSLSGYDTKRLTVRGHFTGGASTGGFSDSRTFKVQIRLSSDGYFRDRRVYGRHIQVMGTKR